MGQAAEGAEKGRRRGTGRSRSGDEWLRRLRLCGEASAYLFGREGTVMTSAIALSFFLAVFPLIVLVLSLASVAGLSGFREAAFTALSGFFPISQEFIIRNLRIYTRGLGQAQIISLLISAGAGSTLFFALEAGLDSALRLTQPRRFLRSQLLGVVMTVLAGFLVFASVFLLDRVHRWTDGMAFAGPVQWMASHAISCSLAFVMFLAVFLWLPSVRRPFRLMFKTSLLASGLWLASDLVFRWLAASWTLQVIYGPFFVSVTILLWAFVMACILLGSARLAADGFFGC